MNIIEEWEDFAKYAHGKAGFYEILGADKNAGVRVSAGKAGFIEFENAIDQTLNVPITLWYVLTRYSRSIGLHCIFSAHDPLFH